MAPLHFIDNSSPFASGDRAVRRAIRSKAAAGKNAGRRVNRPSRAAALRGQLSQRRTLWVTEETGAQMGENSRVIQIPETARSHCSLSLGLPRGVVGTPTLGAALPVHGLPFEAWALSTGSMETIQRGKSSIRGNSARSCFELMPTVLLFRSQASSFSSASGTHRNCALAYTAQPAIGRCGYNSYFRMKHVRQRHLSLTL